MNPQKKKTVLLISSSGGHWIQMNKLKTAFEGFHKVYITTDESYKTEVDDTDSFFTVPDASRWSKARLPVTAICIFGHILKIQPDVVFSTGAAPGLFGIIFGKLFGARTIWMDSIANIEKLSLSGQMARKFSDLWLTQWEHLSRPEGPHFKGAVL